MGNEDELPINGVRTLSTGKSYSFVLTSTGDLIGFGKNEFKQLGTGGVGHLYDPDVVESDIIAVSSSVQVSAIIDKDNKLYMMGNNSDGVFGDGRGLNTFPSPELIRENVAKVSVGYGHSAIITTLGDLYTSGENGFGQLGNGTNVDSTSFGLNPIATNVRDVAVGGENSNTTYYITDNNDLYATGANNQGQLGNNATDNVKTPVLIKDNVKDVRASFTHSLILLHNGELYGTGSNVSHQINNTVTPNYYVPTLITTGIKSIETGADCSFYIDNSNDLYGIGYNNHGRLGLGETSNITEYTFIMSNVKEVSSYLDHTLFLKNDGSVWAAGDNPYGALGTKDQVDWKTPVRILQDLL